MKYTMRRGEGEVIVVFSVLVILVAVITGLMFGIPKYRVWTSELAGRAEFVRAEQNRQIKIEEAKAELACLKAEIS